MTLSGKEVHLCVLILRLLLKTIEVLFWTNFKSESGGQRIRQKVFSDAREGGRNKRREKTRTPPVGVILQLSWMKNLGEAFVSFPLVVERGSFAQTSSLKWIRSSLLSDLKVGVAP